MARISSLRKHHLVPLVTYAVLLSLSLLSMPVVTGFVTHSEFRSSRNSILLKASNYVPPPGKRPPPQGGDMAYIKENIQRQMNTYGQIREVGGSDCVTDVYVRDPKQSKFWFVGKVARCTGTVSVKEAIARQLNLIEEHATRVRPVELGRSFGKLEVWTAPGDSELRYASNEPTAVLQRAERYVEGCENVDPKEIGFDAQFVTNEGVGFFVERTDSGAVPPELLS